MAQIILNNGDSGLTDRNAINSMFAEVYSAIITPIKQPGLTGNTTQAILANTYIQDISLSATVGTPTIRIGTTPNGTDILPDTVLGNSLPITTQLYCPNATTIYITKTGSGTYSVRMDVLNNYY